MDEKQLSKRLQCVADFVPKGSRLADIGSDHAYLPTYLCLKDDSLTAIAGELNEGPYQLAKKQVKRLDLQERIDVRKGNGLQVLHVGEADVVTVAGMGGELIRDILDEGQTKLEGVSTLILQPNVSAKTIRIWLRQHGWRLNHEVILEEDERVYEVLVAIRGEDEDIYDIHLEEKLLLGPYLIKQRNAAFYKKWNHELQNWKRILKQLDLSRSEDVNQKRQLLMEKVHMVEEVLSWE